jgi:hypothetical protein
VTCNSLLTTPSDTGVTTIWNVLLGEDALFAYVSFGSASDTPPIPTKEITILPSPPTPPTPRKSIATPLARERMKRIMAKLMEGGSDAVGIDNDSVALVGRATQAPRTASLPPTLMHPKHATAVVV